jgi:hypothetical protein
MSVEIKWTDTDPATGQRRYLCVHRFAGEWWFKWKLQRRGEWTKEPQPTLEMWEHVLERLHRRYRRREGVTDEDLTKVTRIVDALRKRRREEEEE